MKDKIKKASRLLIAVALGVMAIHSTYRSAEAARAASGAADTVYPRNVYIHQGVQVAIREKGVKTFGIDSTVASILVLDEASVAPTTGLVTGVEVESTAGCGLYLWDTIPATSEVLPGTTHKATLLTAPIFSTVAGNTAGSSATKIDFSAAPLQFHKGLTGKLSTATACSAYIHWARNGGAD